MIEYGIWVYTGCYLMQVDLGDWPVERLVDLFPNAIYFYAGITMAD
jgi:hypothetical protein